ncbi:hypothetical protein HQN89_03460 [Paenibacillus frigoriresistens]|nr:hypothetical protein [Paenibacillus frigoriresistens]
MAFLCRVVNVVALTMTSIVKVIALSGSPTLAMKNILTSREIHNKAE